MNFNVLSLSSILILIVLNSKTILFRLFRWSDIFIFLFIHISYEIALSTTIDLRYYWVQCNVSCLVYAGKSKTTTIIAIVVSIVAIMVLILICIYLRARKRSKRFTSKFHLSLLNESNCKCWLHITWKLL